ncbi:T9SS type A sorting domain-containing protein [Wenyingzhuangia sp. IMCC45574]
MKKTTLLKLILTILFYNTLLNAQTSVGGGIFSDTVWTLENSPYTVTNDVVVFDNVKLTIEPGVIIEFDDSKEMEIRGGNLQAIGNNTKKIIFKSSSQNPSKGIWKGLRFVNRSSLDNSKLEFVEISFANIAIDTKETQVFGSDPIWSISNSKFYMNDIAIDVDSSEENNFYNCIFDNNRIAINSLNYSEVLNCVFENNEIGIGYVFDTLISKNIFRNNTGTALISFRATIDGNLLENNNTAIDIKLFTNSVVKNNIVINNNIGFVVKGESNSPVNGFFNNCIYNNSLYNIKHENNIGLNLSNNFWNTTISSEIENTIYHAVDDIALGLIDFSSFQNNCEALNTLSIENYAIHNKNFSLSSFPNPIDRIVTIEVNLKKDGKYLLNLFDSTGRMVKKISNKNYSSGEHKIILDTQNLNSGIYYLTLRNSSNSITKKLIKI